MKKLGVAFAIIAVIALAGCGTGGGGGAAASGGGGGEAFIVDLSKLSYVVTTDSVENLMKSGNFQTQPGVKNAKPFSKAWDDLLILLPADALPSDFSKYTRFTVSCKYYDESGTEIPQGDSNCIVSMIYDLKGDLRGPAQGAGANTPVKEFNVGGFSGLVHKDRGIRITFSQAPQGVLFQNNSGSKTTFIEMTSMVFHNGDYKSE
jgi:hypothetical protein